MRKFRRQALINQSLQKEVTLTDMKVLKLTDQTFDEWNTSFTIIVGKQSSLTGISLDYLLRENKIGNNGANWPFHEENLKFCIDMNGLRYKLSTEFLYSLLVEHNSTVGYGSNLVIKHKCFKEGSVLC